MKSAKSKIKKNDIWYFAYGSNMKESQLRERGINPKKSTIGYVDNYFLKFNKKSTDGSSKANIENREGEKIWGVFYQLSEKDYLILHEKFEKGYDQIELTGIADKKPISSKSFIASPLRIDNSLKPTKEYQNRIIEGAKEKGLPKEYINFLKKKETSDTK